MPQTRCVVKGDLDVILKRRYVRLLVPYSKTLYMIDRGRQMGVAAELGREFEAWLNAKYAKGPLKIQVFFLPVPRDQLLTRLEHGQGDIAAGAIAVTPERKSSVEFSTPWVANVKEIVVTGPAAPMLNSLEDLSGRDVFVRASSAYYTHLSELSAEFASRGREPINIRPIDENLEDEDILQMVSSGMLPYAVVYDLQAKLWSQLLPDLKLRADLTIHEHDNCLGNAEGRASLAEGGGQFYRFPRRQDPVRGDGAAPVFYGPGSNPQCGLARLTAAFP
jgi:membrane-bound lytic murein transglycosylase MltF